MAQESWTEINETEFQKPDARILCTNNCGFFGSPMTNNLCSKCYRDLVMNEQVLELVKPPNLSPSSMVVESVPEQVEELNVKITVNVDLKASEDPLINQHKNRCFLCRRRVGLTPFTCRCGSTFCSTHRYPEAHECSFDYKYAGREAIAKENPVVKAEKIEKI
ncbi:zinc finger A20 and AN1 domain-containing stress-associated protein 9-like [Phalaenopsis equestris]|uniref:zinc finger A20 and AN1 domain-containing stress-associated protein 9-like n=1 Tax=Phalaenopsis equestris TaxID=78828 RepID=UPI0009E1FD00|nr:zinc finger A20 and AN1 domain-containing stress-associated protein 9-like [Phalaenopsis equestris]XP_020589204.1 zinc finger A20 and AN1 domain-containing stress-associated protein 9-like [Phalaenopsis equestris]